MTYYAALDVSLRTVNLCVIDDEGQIKDEAKLASEVEDIVAHLQNLDCPVSSVGLEAGTLTQYLTYGLQAAGYEMICMEARQVKAALSAMRNKTDKHDARGIAQILRSGWSPGRACRRDDRFRVVEKQRPLGRRDLELGVDLFKEPGSVFRDAQPGAVEDLVKQLFQA